MSSSLNQELEAMVQNMGASVSENEQTEQTEEVIEAQAETQPEQQAEVEQEVAQETVEEIQQQEEAVEEIPQSSLQEEEEITEEEIETAMFSFLSERLGREVKSLDEFQSTQNTSVEIDERVSAINDFVNETGRDPKDWFTYQAMNPSEMDDLSLVKMQIKNQYGDLSDSDVKLLIDNKYKLDEDLYEDNEVRLSQIQLKMDADKARQEIEGLRSKFAAPVKQEQADEEYQGIVDEDWLNNMSAEVDALEGIEFELGKDKSFTFGLEDNYKSQLKSKNGQIEDFFTSYMDNSGQWDFEKWNMHQAVLDNIEMIVKSAYSQGLGDGQKGLVNKAANVQYTDPSQMNNTGQSNSLSVEEQARIALGMNDNKLTFKI